MRPKRSLGQNFLIDPNYKRKIIQAVLQSNPKTILEIGPGKGVLTEELVEKCEKLICVEKDGELANDLQNMFRRGDPLGCPIIESKTGSNIRATHRVAPTVIHDDFLKIDLSTIYDSRSTIHDPLLTAIGNLPYNVSSQILIKLLVNRKYFSDLYLMFQKEVALRMMAKPKTRDYGLLTLWTQIYTHAKILFHLPPTAFRPRPKVQSSFVHFKIKEKSLLNDEESEFFWKLMHVLFQQRRKTIVAVLKKSKGYASMVGAYVNTPQHANTRAEELSVEELIRLARGLKTLEASS